MKKPLTFLELSQSKNLPDDYKEIFKVIAGTYPDKPGVTDSEKSHSLSDIEFIRNKQHEIVKANMVKDGMHYDTLDEIKARSQFNVEKLKTQLKSARQGVTDSYWNSVTGIGTGIDPNYYTSASIPVSLSPYEASAIYSNGGLAKVIIDKKSKGVMLNEYEFEGLNTDDAQKLKEYSLKIGFDRALPLRDALIFGGAGMYPKFKNDNIQTYLLSLDELMRAGVLDTNCIDYWITPDRWNMVHVPNYIITARDYLRPEFVYVPLGSQKVKTERMALIKPYALPYWAAIQQLGWSTSDFVGYIKQIYDYEIMISSLPIMFQQMSLIFQTIPFDATMLTNGPDEVKKLQVHNEEQMRSWSNLQARLVNSIGDIKVIERTFTGFEDMVKSMERNIGARSTIPESVLFHTQPTGFSDNKEDLTLKQSESIKMLCNEVAPQLKNEIKILTVSCFGRNSTQAKADVTIKFGTPIVSSEGELADIGSKQGSYVQSMTGAGMPLDIAINLSKQFFKFEMDENDFKRIEEIPEQPPEGEPDFLKLINNTGTQKPDIPSYKTKTDVNTASR